LPRATSLFDASSQIQRNPVTQLKTGLFFGEILGRVADLRWNPAWKWDSTNSVRTRRRMLLLHGSEGLFVQRVRQANYCRPESTVNIGNLSVHQTAHEHLITATYRPSCQEDYAFFLVPPPIATYGLTGYGFGQIRSGPSTCFQYDTVLFNEPQRVHRLLHRIAE
jgi:hypothetical protein